MANSIFVPRGKVPWLAPTLFDNLCLYYEIGFRPAILYSNHTNNIRVQNKENAGTTIKTCPKEKK
jgi:hypothetical protein